MIHKIILNYIFIPKIIHYVQMFSYHLNIFKNCSWLIYQNHVDASYIILYLNYGIKI